MCIVSVLFLSLVAYNAIGQNWLDDACSFKAKPNSADYFRFSVDASVLFLRRYSEELYLKISIRFRNSFENQNRIPFEETSASSLKLRTKKDVSTLVKN